MGMYQIEIVLLSDMCVSDGGVYNSVLDMDICYDDQGFPYIPAKRLKGCLRECALELNDWGKEILIDEIFGKKGDTKADLRLGNAYLEGYTDMRAEVGKYKNTLVCHPQNILGHFSYVRTQTSIDHQTGVADDTSLRTMRVADKGLIFIADADVDEQYHDPLSICCSALKSMGVSRTRGLGEVQVTLRDKKADGGGNEEDPVHAAWMEGADCLTYTLRLEEPLICKSINGGESRTMDYIEGSKILGLIAQQLKENGHGDIRELLDQGELFCSNAYIQKDGTRMLEVPASFYTIKNDGDHYINKIYETKEIQEDEDKKKRQINQMKHCYVSADSKGRLIQCGVDIENRYHHSRPEDKSIGRAYEKEGSGSVFYQMSSITSGQVFQGYILGSTGQIEEIYQQMSKKHQYHMGYSSSAEYGKVSLQITEVSKKPERIWEGCKDFQVKLESPAIIYNSKAMYSVDVKELIAEVDEVLGIDNAVVKKYINYTTLGGYNVTWHERKPVISAFDKGTVLRYHLDQPMDLPSFLLVGERVAEGFGEATVAPLKDGEGHYQGQIVDIEDPAGKPEMVDAGDSILLRSICDDLFREFVREKAAVEAKKASVDDKETLRPTVSSLLLICKENRNLEEMEDVIKDRFDKRSEKKSRKLQEAEKILRDVRSGSACLLDGFCRKYNVTDYSFDREEYECIYMDAYLNELKYWLRKKELEENQPANDED